MINFDSLRHPIRFGDRKQGEWELLWLNDHKRILKTAILLLLLEAFAGPWTYDRINVPAQYTCADPFIRLSGDFCGLPQSGALIIQIIGGEFIYIGESLLSGAAIPVDLGRDFLIFLLSLFIFLPIFSSLLSILIQSRRWQIINLVVAALAVITSLVWLSFSIMTGTTLHVWGLWLYPIMLISMLLLEGLFIFKQTSLRNPSPVTAPVD